MSGYHTHKKNVGIVEWPSYYIDLNSMEKTNILILVWDWIDDITKSDFKLKEYVTGKHLIKNEL